LQSHTRAVSGSLAAPGALIVFCAVLGPMSTLPALRRLLLETHGLAPSAMHGFVAAGMAGSLLGAPWLGSLADRRGNHLRLAAWLAALDAAVALATSLPALPTVLLFLLRPLHGAASMATLALLFGSFRGSRRQLVSQVGAAALSALAIGPALGGGLTRLGPAAPFRFAAALSLLLSGWLLLSARTAASPSQPERRELGQVWVLARRLWAPLLLVASQRFAIGGLVAAFAVHLRAAHGLSDAHVGMCFSLLLCVFAAGTWWLGRRSARDSTGWLVGGALLFAGALTLLGCAPVGLLLPALGLAGLGAAFVYAPILSLVASLARPRATAMALLHAAGGVGMVLGPLGALGVDWALRGSLAEVRTGAFMAASGIAHALCALGLLPALRALGDQAALAAGAAE
jgi:MFS family permease